MPISYTKRGWTNNSPPAINAANLGAMDDGLKNAIDALNNMGDAGQQAVKEIGAAPAATTGGKLVNKITEAGYSLAPASGLASLDNIADGTSYKRVLATVATALNEGTYDAASVLAFGIGGDVKFLANCYDLNTLGGLGTGIYKVYDATNRPTGINNYAYVIQIKFDTSNCYQEYIAGPTSGCSAIKWFRYKESGTWSSWYKVWTSLSDGNYGRPPIGKPAKVYTIKASGEYNDVGIASNCTYLVHAWNATIGGLALAFVGNNGSDYFIANIVTNANISITLSGTSIRITNTNAGTCSVHYAITQLSAGS